MQWWSIRMRAAEGGKHVSGAEAIVVKEQIVEKVKEFATRALSHPRGNPDNIHITVETIRENPVMLRSLPVYTVRITGHSEAWRFIERLLNALRISSESFQRARRIVRAGNMRGAALLTVKTARRLEKDPSRGVRATRLGITREAEDRLTRLLNQHKLPVRVVKEALVLATKVASAPHVVAELCVSDNPDYTTGYISSPRTGYIRIPYIKKQGELSGGRVFFVKEECNPEETAGYLQQTPVLVYDIGEFHGEVLPEHVFSLCSG